MADNKTKPTKFSVAAFIDAVTVPVRRSDAKALIKLMQNTAGEKPRMWGPSIIGFGSCHYKYEIIGKRNAKPVGTQSRAGASSIPGSTSSMVGC